MEQWEDRPIFGDLLDLDFLGDLGGDFDWGSLVDLAGDAAEGLGDVSDLFYDQLTGELVTADQMQQILDLDLSGSGSGPVMESPFSGSLDSSPISRSLSDHLRSLEGSGAAPGEDQLWRDFAAPFTGTTAQMPEESSWLRDLLRGAGNLVGQLGGDGNPLAALTAGSAPRASVSGMGRVGGDAPSVLGALMGLGGSDGRLRAGEDTSSGLRLDASPSLAGAPRVDAASLFGAPAPQEGQGLPQASPQGSLYTRDPITGMLIPASAPVAPIERGPIPTFSPIQLPFAQGAPVQMAGPPAPKLSGLQRLLMESRRA